jgi:hypothetical protein
VVGCGRLGLRAGAGGRCQQEECEEGTHG